MEEAGTVDVLAAHADRLTHVVHQPARPGVVEPWPDSWDPQVRAPFEDLGITALWGHQAEALRHLDAGRDVIVTTGTASGKSLVYMAEALRLVVRGRAGDALQGHRRPTILYIAPTKALASDQRRRLPDLPALRAATVDGDTAREARTWARDHANYVLTNPDMLHHALLPGHERWARLFRGLSLVVVDECHHYRGVFGSHVAQILRRVQRIAEHHGADPRFVLSSATIAEPAEFAKRLTGRDVASVTEDASAAPGRTIALWEPPLIPSADGHEVRRSATREAAELLAGLVTRDVRSLVFVRSRRGAEEVAGRTRDLLDAIDARSGRSGKVATYRGGYLPEERRELENRLRDGDLVGLTATSALELGIDVSGLDAVVTLGFPGTRASLWQQFGRAGRQGTDSLGVFIARDEPIDLHVVRHPETILDAPLEATVLDPDNPYVLGPHLAAAAQEMPLTTHDLGRFGPRALEGVEALTAAGLLRKRPAGWFWTKRERASDLADLRSSGGAPVSIVETDTGRVIGTVDASSADRDVHEGAVYVHQGETYVVREYAPEDRVALAEAGDPPYTTQASSSSAVTILAVRESRAWGEVTVGFGDVSVEGQVTGFQVRDARTGRTMGQQALDLPVRTLRTAAVWWSVPPSLVAEVVENDLVGGAAHAAEHASIGLLPLFATCDRWDIGGVSTALHPDTGEVTVFVHDGHPGGAGFAERGFHQLGNWLQTTRDVIAQCRCSSGCPACIVSPKCGNGNSPLDKGGAIALLDLVLVSRTD